MESASNFTGPAVASLMTGKRVWTHQIYHIEASLPYRSRAENLAAVLKKNGYFNISLAVNPFASVRILGITDSFDIAPPASEFGEARQLFGWKFGIIDRILYRAFGEKIKLHNWILKNDFVFGRFLNLVSRSIFSTTVPPDRVFRRFITIITHEDKRPFFAWLHLFPPHDPYLPPEPYKNIFRESDELRAYKPQERLVEESYQYLFKKKPFPSRMQPAIDAMRDYYDEYIRYIDEEFKDLVAMLSEQNSGSTIIIFSADHGESFDHGYFTHGGPFLFEDVTNIPLIIKMPGQQEGTIITDRVEQIDIPATILDMVNIPVPQWMEGRSLLPLMKGQKLPQGPFFP